MSETPSDSELELARIAKDAFDNHRYESCLSTLNKLQETRRHDGRVIHNRAVTMYLLSNLTMTDEFRKSLHHVSMQFDHEAESGKADAPVSDKGVLLYNQALIHMRLHQNTQAIEILEQLFSVHNFLDDTLAAEVCLLLTEMYVSTYQLDKATKYLEFAENKLFGKSLSMGGNGGKEEMEGGDSTEKYRPKVLLFKARLSLLHGNVKACKKDIKTLINSAGNTPCAQFLKANVEYLCHNYLKALKVLSSAPTSPIVTNAGECLSAFYFNNVGCLHFHLGKFHLAAHYLKKAIEENDAALNGFPPLDRATPLSGRPLAVLGMNCRHILLYNLGLQQLYGGHPLAAFDSFLEVVQVYHANPRLWLRLAESCLASHARSSHEKVPGIKHKSDTIRMMFGSGLHRKLVVAPIQQSTRKGSVDTHSQSAAMPAPTLEFAAICLRNALFLLLSTKSSASGVSSEATPQATPALPGPPIKGDDVISLRCSVLACLAYVSLGLGDSVSALKYSKQLLSSPKLPGGLKFLGQLYAAEALVNLDRVADAMHYLKPESITDVSTTLTDTQRNDTADQSLPKPTTSLEGASIRSFPVSAQLAKAVMYFNLSAAFCVCRDLDKARTALHQATALYKAAPPQFSLLSAYIELASGNTSLSLEIIKKCQPFPLGNEKKRVKSTYITNRP